MAYRDSFVYDSDMEDEDIENSSNDEGVPSRSITIDESSAESEEESIPRIKNLKKKNVLLDDTDSDSDSSEIKVSNSKTPTSINRNESNKVVDNNNSDSYTDEEEFEERAISPRTRMSITGIRPKDMSSDSSIFDEDSDRITEEEDSENEGSGNSKTLYESHKDSDDDQASNVSQNDSNKSHSIVLDTSMKEYNSPKTNKRFTDEFKRSNKSDSIVLDTSMKEYNSPKTNKRFTDVFEKSNKSHSIVLDTSMKEYNSPKTNKRFTDVFERSNKSHSIVLDTSMKEYNSPKTNIRFTDVFETSINTKLSSTTYKSTENNNSFPNSSNNRITNSDDSVIMESPAKPNIIELSSSSESSVQMTLVKSPKKIQPKITTALQQTPKLLNQGNVFVSKEFYDGEVKKLEDLRSEMMNSESLLESLASRLPDNGRQLAIRVNKLKADIKKKALKLATYVIEENTKLHKSKENLFFPQKVPDWDELSNAVNQIQPKHTGRQGLATFNNEKVLTVERLKDIHGSIETCPGPNELSEDPNGLNVELMPHQKYALTWMSWREKQRPRGGILADDMGLGKTLTMISLILSCKNKSEEDDGEKENEESESEDESVKENHGWSSKNRREYYNGGTLVVCPASLIGQWENEALKRIKRNVLTVCVHHGNNRETNPKRIRKYDIVVTTYNIVSRESKFQGALFGIKWRRIILDEAHIIRNYKSLSALAVCQLRGKYRWTLTGTPIQNKEMDLYALIKFLKCSPFDELGHWKKWIDNKSAGGQQRLNTLIKSLMLRRTKVQLQEMGELMTLPDKSINLIEVELDKEEMNVYQKIMIFSRTLFSQYLQQRSDRRNEINPNVRTYAEQMRDKKGMYYQLHERVAKMHGAEEIKSHQILTLLLRLRQICCHPGLIDAMLEDETKSSRLDESSDCSQTDVNLLDQLSKMEIHDKNSSGTNEKDDSLHESNSALTKASQKVLRKSNPVFNLSQPSSKMKKVLELFEEKVLSSTDKAIIVSQWTSVLNLLKTHLANKHIPTLSLDGSINVKNRQPIINEFNDPNNRSKVLLLSLTAGGVGLNLVGANHLFLIDLHWNPQLESQAQDRIYRFGQKKNVFIYKFMVKDTVEERIKALQDQKLAIASGVLTGTKDSEGHKLSMDDLKGLFGL